MSGCNGCSLEELKKKYGDQLVKHNGSYYLKNELVSNGETQQYLPDGTPIRFIAWFMSEGHDHSSSAADDLIDDYLDNEETWPYDD